jgi:hypothetical protein
MTGTVCYVSNKLLQVTAARIIKKLPSDDKKTFDVLRSGRERKGWCSI